MRLREITVGNVRVRGLRDSFVGELVGSATAVGTEVEIDVFGEWVPGEIAREPLFDPDGASTRLRLR